MGYKITQYNGFEKTIVLQFTQTIVTNYSKSLAKSEEHGACARIVINCILCSYHPKLDAAAVGRSVSNAAEKLSWVSFHILRAAKVISMLGKKVHLGIPHGDPQLGSDLK